MTPAEETRLDDMLRLTAAVATWAAIGEFEPAEDNTLAPICAGLQFLAVQRMLETPFADPGLDRLRQILLRRVEGPLQQHGVTRELIAKTHPMQAAAATSYLMEATVRAVRAFGAKADEVARKQTAMRVILRTAFSAEEAR